MLDTEVSIHLPKQEFKKLVLSTNDNNASTTPPTPSVDIGGMKELEYKRSKSTTPNLKDIKAYVEGKYTGKRKVYRSPKYLEYQMQLSSAMMDVGKLSEGKRIATCGTAIVYKCKSCGDIHYGLFNCRSRVCPRCSELLTWQRFHEIKKHIPTLKAKFRYGKHITFTTINKKVGDYRGDLFLVRKGLNSLRRYFKRYIKDYACMWGIEFAEEGMCHVHMLMFVDYWLDEKKLAEVWGKGFIEIKTLESDKQILNVCAYALRFVNKDGFLPVDQVAQYSRAMKGVRMFGCWGDLYGKVRASLRSQKKSVCKVCGSEVEGVMYPHITYSMIMNC